MRARTQGNTKSKDPSDAKKVLGDSKMGKQANAKEDLPQSQAGLDKRRSQARMRRNRTALRPRNRAALKGGLALASLWNI